MPKFLSDIDPKASKTKAGVVKIGEGIEVTSDGTISVTGGSSSGGDTIPIGTVVACATPSIPEGWLLCDGSAVSRVKYADLFNAIGTTYGTGDNSSTFNLPDYRKRVIVGSTTIYPTFPLDETTYRWVKDNGVYKSTNNGVSSSTSTMKSEPFTITGSATLEFDWACSSENVSYDYGYFSIYKNGTLVANTGSSASNAKIGGNNSTYPDEASLVFTSKSFSLTSSGTYYIEFSYKKDSSVNKGADKLLVKNIKVKPSGLSVYDLGDTGGEAVHTLTVSEMPSHTHTMSAAGNHNHTVKFDQVWNTNGGTTSLGTVSGGPYGGAGFVNDAGAHTHSLGNTGNGASHNNMQPYGVGNYIIKATSSSLSNNNNNKKLIAAKYEMSSKLYTLGGARHSIPYGSQVFNYECVNYNSSEKYFTALNSGIYLITMGACVYNGSDAWNGCGYAMLTIKSTGTDNEEFVSNPITYIPTGSTVSANISKCVYLYAGDIIDTDIFMGSSGLHLAHNSNSFMPTSIEFVKLGDIGISSSSKISPETVIDITNQYTVNYTNQYFKAEYYPIKKEIVIRFYIEDIPSGAWQTVAICNNATYQKIETNYNYFSGYANEAGQSAIHIGANGSLQVYGSVTAAGGCVSFKIQ